MGVACSGAACVSAGIAPLRAAEPRAAIAMQGEPAMAPGFTAFPYANPDAPKGGQLVQGALGTFDSLNPFIVKGEPAISLRGYVVESLLARSYDEPFTLYGLLAQSVETDAARSYVTFTIDPRAKFSDGAPVTAQDVIFSWKLLRDHGRPNFRTYYIKVAKAEALGEHVVRFDFSDSHDRELPLILGLMPVLPRHAIDEATFEQTTLKPIVGSGPYVIAQVDAGRSVTLQRDPNYWGRDLPVNRGLWNFDTLRFDYYRDDNAAFEAFQRGLYDVRAETDPARWEKAYDFPAARDRRVVKRGAADHRPAERPARLRVQHAQAHFRRHAGTCRDRDAVRLRVDQQEFLLRRLPPLGELLRRQRAVRLPAPPPDARERALDRTVSRKQRAARHPRRLRGRCRSATAADVTAPFCAAPSACSMPPATRLRRRRAARPRERPAVRRSRSWSPISSRSASPLRSARPCGSPASTVRVRTVDAVQYDQRSNSLSTST